MISLEAIHRKNLFLNQSRYRKIADESHGLDYIKKEFALSGGLWAGRQVQPLYGRTRGNVLLLGDSDEDLPFCNYALLRSVGGYREIYSTHLSKRYGRHSKLLPLGLPYEDGYGFPFDVLGDIRILMDVFRQTPPPRLETLGLFGAFSEETHEIRPVIRRLISESPNGYWGTYPVTLKGRFDYLAHMRRLGLTVCPPGRGLDTYRFWEAIYVGATPIVVSPPQTFREAIKGLPAIILEDWRELGDFHKIREKWMKVYDTSHNFSAASIEFVLRQIKGGGVANGGS